MVLVRSTCSEDGNVHCLGALSCENTYCPNGLNVWIKSSHFGNFQVILKAMRIIARKTLKSFWKKAGNGDAEQPLKAWFAEAKKARWKKPQDIKDFYRSASFVGNDRVVFNIGGNKYRLVVALKYDFGILYVRFIGSHRHYDKIKVEEV
jgi:mRNA interferase HigB